MWGREESRLNTPRTGVPREERETTPQKPVEDVKLQEAPRARSRWMGRSHGPHPPRRQPAGRRAEGWVQTKKAGGKVLGAQEGPANVLPVPPTPGRLFPGSWGCPCWGSAHQP